MFFLTKSPEEKLHIHFLLKKHSSFSPSLTLSKSHKCFLNLFFPNVFSLLSLVILILHSMLPLVSYLFHSSLPSNLNPIWPPASHKRTKNLYQTPSLGDRDRLKLDQTNKTIPDKSLSSLNWILKSYGSIWNFSAIWGELLAQVAVIWGQNPSNKHRQVSGETLHHQQSPVPVLHSAVYFCLGFFFPRYDQKMLFLIRLFLPLFKTHNSVRLKTKPLQIICWRLPLAWIYSPVFHQ